MFLTRAKPFSFLWLSGLRILSRCHFHCDCTHDSYAASRTPHGMRGLKFFFTLFSARRPGRTPQGVRGLKFTEDTRAGPAGMMVAPRKGAWIEISEDQAIAARQQTRRSGLAEQIAQYPARLQAYTPDKLKAALESGGYEVRPLGRGKLKGVSFEDGGGFRVNFSDGGLLQYHPDQGSHHDGAYYKISTGTKGVIRYDIDGKRKKI